MLAEETVRLRPGDLPVQLLPNTLSESALVKQAIRFSKKVTSSP